MAVDRRTIALGLVCIAPAFGDNSDADSVSSTYGDNVVEASHVAKVNLEGRVAVFTVRRTLQNNDEHADEARIDITLPPEGTATGLRMRSRGGWIKAELHAAEHAAKEYERLTTTGPTRSRGPAELSWTATGEVGLVVFPVRRQAPREVEYTVRAPTCYRDGVRMVGYPLDSPGGAPKLVAARGRAYLAIDKAPLRVQRAAEGCMGDSGSDAASFAWAVFEANVKDELTVAYGSFDTGSEQTIARLEIDARQRLSQKPRRAEVVFVIDASHSQGTAGIAAQIELAKIYLSHVPDASFEIVLYRRYAERLLGRFAPAQSAADAIAAVPSAALDPNNGSNLDEGLGLAATLLAGTDGPARVVAFTDSRLRVGFDNTAAIAGFQAAPSQTVLHIVDNPSDVQGVSFGRYDGHELADVAGRYGGIVVSESGHLWADTEESMLALVRPLQIDSFEIEGAIDGLGANVNDVLSEGEAYRFMDVVSAGAAPSSLRITGKIWARDFSQTVGIDPALTAELPALVFGTPDWNKLDPASIETVARTGKAVSPATSYLAVDPDIGPGATDVAGGIIGGRSFGGSSRCGLSYPLVGIGTRGFPRDAIDLNEVLASWLEPATHTCQALHETGAHTTKVSFELHSKEVADVAVTTTGSDDFAMCIADAAWEIQLDSRFYRGFDRRNVNL